MKFKYILVLFSLFASPCKITQGFPVNLVGSSLSYAGRVEIETDGSWTSICDVNWNMKNSHVVCRQLGYVEAEAAISGEAFGPAPGQIAMKQFRCYGNERSLMKCPSNDNITTSCNKRTVAAVLCTPKNFLLRIFIISAILCLAITSIIMLIVTYKTMHLRRLIEKQKSSRPLPATNSEIGVSNLNVEEFIETDTTLANTPSNEEPKVPLQEENLDVNNKKEQLVNTPSDAELIIPCNKEDLRVDETKGHVAKRKESHKKSRYMRLKRGSMALIHFYTKLLERNRNPKPTTPVDYTEDYYSFSQKENDCADGSVGDIYDVGSNSTGEYIEIYSDTEENKDNDDKDGYVPMLSLSHMCTMEVAAEVQNPLEDEYIEILPATDLSKANESTSYSKGESDYLDPVVTNLPSYPETLDDATSCSYDEELPEPPKECETLLFKCNDNEINPGNFNSLGLYNQGCWCKDDLISNKCLNNHSIEKKEERKECEQKLKPRNDRRSAKEDQSDENLEYLPIGLYSTGANTTSVRESVRRNSLDYAMLVKKPKKDFGNFSEELNKTLSKQKSASTLPQSVDVRLKPNETDVYDSLMGSRGREEVKQGFSAYKDYFENQADKKVEKTCSLSRPSFNSKEIKPNINTASNQLVYEAPRKLRSESCPVEGASGQKEIEMEHNYELDYEDVSSPNNSRYENNDIYSNDSAGFARSGTDSDECEYDYVNQKERNSLHFYEAVAKHSEEDDPYEKI